MTKRLASAALMALMLVAAGCSRGKEKSADTLPAEDTPVMVQAEDSVANVGATIPLTKDGLPGIEIGMSADKIPQSVEGLYDHVNYVPDSDYGALYQLQQGNDVSAVVGVGFDGKKVEWITVYTPAVYGELSNGRRIVTGMPVKEFSEITGITRFEYDEMTGINVVVGPYNVTPAYEVTAEADERVAENGDGKGVFTLQDFLPTATIYTISVNHK